MNRNVVAGMLVWEIGHCVDHSSRPHLAYSGYGKRSGRRRSRQELSSTFRGDGYGCGSRRHLATTVTLDDVRLLGDVRLRLALSLTSGDGARYRRRQARASTLVDVGHGSHSRRRAKATCNSLGDVWLRLTIAMAPSYDWRSSRRTGDTLEDVRQRLTGVPLQQSLPSTSFYGKRSRHRVSGGSSLRRLPRAQLTSGAQWQWPTLAWTSG
jgi:hypothetical protein